MPQRPHNAPIDFDLTGDNGDATTSALSADSPVQHDAPSPRLREQPAPSSAHEDAADDAVGRAGHDDRWVAHRRDGWTVEQHGQAEPVSTHDTFEGARDVLANSQNHSAASTTDTPDHRAQEADDMTDDTGTDVKTVEGWVVDIACLRKYSDDQLASRAQIHTTECALMGHCVESGYGLVDADGRVHLLDDAATPTRFRSCTPPRPAIASMDTDVEIMPTRPSASCLAASSTSSGTYTPSKA